MYLNRMTLHAPANYSPRERLTSDRVLFVRSDGDNRNSGLEDSLRGAFKDWQYASWVASKFDFDGRKVTLQAGDEEGLTTFTHNVTLHPMYGGGTLLIKGAGSEKTVWTSAAGDTWTLSNTGLVQVNFENGSIRSAQNGIKVNYSSMCNIGSDVDFGDCDGHAIWVHDNQAICQILNSRVSISGKMLAFLFIQYGHCFLEGSELTAHPGSAFGHGFITMFPRGSAQVIGNSVSGSAEGRRFNISHLSLLNLNGADEQSQLLGAEPGVKDAASVVF